MAIDPQQKVVKVNPNTLRRLLEPLVESGRGRNVGLESRAIENIDFDPTSGDLTVIFVERGTYVYHDIPLDTYVDFAGAESWGRYFNLYIRDQGFSYEKVD